jgi:DNA-binding NtrC family response regulator
MSEARETLTHISSELDGSGRLYLLVLESDSSSVFPLPRDGQVVVGRVKEAELRLKDQVSSRRHARFTVLAGRVTVEDLESHNGTRVNGERIGGKQPLESGDVVTIGGATMVLHAGEQPRLQPRLLDEAGFRSRLLQELDRASSYARPLTVLVALGPLEARRIEPVAGKGLRAMDVAALLGPDELVALCPELAGPEAAGAAERLCRALSPIAPAVRVGVASFPADGCDGETLLSAARSAARAAPTGQSAAAVDSVVRLTVGERTVLLADPAMIRLFELIKRLAGSSMPVLVTGETGAGKELAASAIHYSSPREKQKFVALNCAAMQETLVESELFGYERGAFSGAVGQKQGLLEVADGGTLFLDEVGELSLSVQAKLLRALEEKRILRLGGTKPIDVDLRLVAATHRNLEAEVKAGRFRQDLFFRLGAATVVLPPLRDRPRELGILSRAFLEQASRDAPKTLSPATLQVLAAYAWPGNVRELRNTMEYLAAAVPEELIEPWHLPARITGESEPAPAAVGVDAAPAEAAPSRRFASLADELRELEVRRMREALDASRGVKSRAAELLGMPLRTFTWKLRQYGIQK